MILKLDLIAYLWDFQGGWYQWADSKYNVSSYFLKCFQVL